MTLPLIDRMLANQPRGTFVRAARARGIRSRLARTLEAAATALAPRSPAAVLEQRELFEQAVQASLQEVADKLELSFETVEALAGLPEKLELARTGDAPDLFRRVWVEDTGGARRRGVVVRRRDGETAVFCPPSRDVVANTGKLVRVSYRGYSESGAYDLVLDDAVSLPGALVLHLKDVALRGTGERVETRLDVHLNGAIWPVETGVATRPGNYQTCRTVNLSTGGLRVTCKQSYAAGRRVQLELTLPDCEAPFTATAQVCWVRAFGDDRTVHMGLAFEPLSSTAGLQLASYFYGRQSSKS